MLLMLCYQESKVTMSCSHSLMTMRVKAPLSHFIVSLENLTLCQPVNPIVFVHLNLLLSLVQVDSAQVKKLKNLMCMHGYVCKHYTAPLA